MKLQDINSFPLFKSMPSIGIFGISNSREGYPNEIDPKVLKYDDASCAALGKGQQASELIKRSVDVLANKHKDFRPEMYSFFRSRATNDIELIIYHSKIGRKDVIKDIMKNYKLDKSTKKMIDTIINLKY